MTHRTSARHIAWLLLAALVLGVLPAQGALSPLVPGAASQSERSEDESAEEQAASAELKACFFRRELRQGLPTRGWLVLSVPRPSAPRVQTRPLEHDDPRRVLIPLRLDPPPDNLV